MELYTLMKGGDKSAFEQIYARYWKKLYDDNYARLKNCAVIERAIQDTFADLWLKRKEKEVVNLYPYLNTCVRYMLYAMYRKNKNAAMFRESPQDEVMSLLMRDTQLNPRELKECIGIWLRSQPFERSEIFRLKHSEGNSVKEISELLGIAQKTVQQQLTKANELLKVFLDKALTIMMMI